ncbi:PaaI family thioesterase [Geodermatophilus sp. DF01-2]|nr:PaaI family thioesterase [Geodermatophilus sp. DF01_2]
MSGGDDRPPVAGDPQVAARLGRGTLEDVPLEVLQAGLRLPLHDHLGLELTGLRPVVVELPLTERSRSLAGPLHGGVLATLVDVAANVAVATSGAVDVTRYGLVTVRAEIDFRAQPSGTRVRAEARVAEVGRRTARTECVVTDDGGRTVGRAAITTRMLPRAGVPGTGLAGAAC